MLGPRAKRHQLHAAGTEGAVVTEAVGMAEYPFPHVGDPLDVGMGVHRPDRARSQPIVIEHPQRPDAHLARIAITIEGEVPARLEPAAVLVVDLAVPA